MSKLNLEKLSFVELLESYDFLVKRHSKDTDEIHQYFSQMLKIGKLNELIMLEKYTLLDDSSKKELAEAIKNRQ